MVKRGSPSLVGRGIANPMFARTRGFESHSPRLNRGFIQWLLVQQMTKVMLKICKMQLTYRYEIPYQN